MFFEGRSAGVGAGGRRIGTTPRWLLAAAALVCTLGCKESDAGTRRSDAAAADQAIELTDDAGFTIRLAGPARRIISLIPSATETLIAIGAGDRLVGRTRYDVAPEVASLPVVGGGLDPSVEAVINLHPDLVLAWESDPRQAARPRLQALGVPVFIQRTEDTSDVFREISNLGRLTGRDSAASAVAASIRATLDSVHRAVAGLPAPSVFYVVYTDPPMTAGPGTFIGQLVSLAGGRSIFADAGQLWPTVSMEEIVHRDPDLLVVPVSDHPDETLDRYHKLPGWRDLRAVRTGRVATVPANLLERPGPAIGAAARALARVLHPERE